MTKLPIQYIQTSGRIIRLKSFTSTSKIFHDERNACRRIKGLHIERGLSQIREISKYRSPLCLFRTKCLNEARNNAF